MTEAIDEKPTLYVVVMGQWGSGDLSGCLMLPTGEVLWSHISSSEGWLVLDLTVGFADRRIELEARYPDGYEVKVARSDDDIPTEVRAANDAWGESLPKSGHDAENAEATS